MYRISMATTMTEALFTSCTVGWVVQCTVKHQWRLCYKNWEDTHACTHTHKSRHRHKAEWDLWSSILS